MSDAFGFEPKYEVTDPRTGEAKGFLDFDEAMALAVQISDELKEDVPVIHVRCDPETGVHLIPHVGCLLR